MTSYYYTLITSLPRHSKQYKVKQTPISQIQLEKRLKILPSTERNIINSLMKLVWLDWFSLDPSLKNSKLEAKKFFDLKNNFINETIHWYFDIRSIYVALRLRNAQKTAPANLQNYWITRWNLRLIQNWNEPDFGLKFVYPWLPEIASYVSKNNTADVEDLLLTQLWKHLEKIESGHLFDFEAVIIYMLRWQIINYWSQFSESAAIKHINEFTSEILATITI